MLELGPAYRGTTLLLSDVLEADDEYTGLHSRDVVSLALAVADEMGSTPACGARRVGLETSTSAKSHLAMTLQRG